jgi:hypothetical protein
METGWKDVTLSVTDVMDLARRWIPAGGLVTLLAFGFLWGWPSLSPLDSIPGFALNLLIGVLVFTAVYAVSAVLHELIHALGIVVFGRLSWRDLEFGHRLSEGIAYVHARRPMTLRAYRGVLILPGLVQGVVPLAAGFALGSGWLTLYGYVMLASAIGDIAVLRILRPFPPHRLVRDHPREVGVMVQE